MPVTAIAENAFRGNTETSTFILPASIRTIGASAFAECSRLKNLDIDSANIDFAFDPDEGILYQYATPGDADGKMILHTYLNNSVAVSLILSDKVVKIGDRAFDSCNNLDMLYLNTDITLGSDVFANITHIFKVYMYDTTGVGSFEFVVDNMVDLNDVFKTTKLTENRVSIDGIKDEYIVGGKLVVGGVTITDLIIPATISQNGNERTVSIIGADAFSGQEWLISVVIRQASRPLQTERSTTASICRTSICWATSAPSARTHSKSAVRI